MLRLIIPGYRREGKRYLTLAVGCTGGKHRSVAIAEEFARRLAASGIAAVAATATWAASERGSGPGRPPRVVAFGGGHGLAAALGGAGGGSRRSVTPSSPWPTTAARPAGIRREMPVLPPGDLRMALAALAGDDARTQAMARLLQHRFGGTGVLAGHPVGNLVLAGLAEMHGGDTVRALDDPPAARRPGRVLPMADDPLDIVAPGRGRRRRRPGPTRTIRGQVAIATTPGRVPRDPRSPRRTRRCPEAVLEAVARRRRRLPRPGLLVHQRAAAPARARAARARWAPAQAQGRGRAQSGAAAGGDRRVLAGGAPGRTLQRAPGRSGVATR